MPAEPLRHDEIAGALDVSERRVRQRAKREHWPSLKIAKQGGRTGEVIHSLLPPDVRQAVARKEAEDQGLVLAQEILPAVQPEGENLIPERSKEIGKAKYLLVHAYRKAKAAAPWGKKIETEKAFVLAYNAQQLLPNVYKVVGPVEVPTLRTLDKNLRDADDDYIVLCDGRGGWKKHGTTKYRGRDLSIQAQQIFIGCYLSPGNNSVTIISCINATRLALQERDLYADYSDSTFRRYLKDFRERFSHIICLAREGFKAYEDKFAPYLSRDFSMLEPGDVWVADGKTLDFMVKHPVHGRPVRMVLIVFTDAASRAVMGWQLMPTANTLSVAAAFMHACMAFGRPPKCVYLDNGKEFKNKFFLGDEGFENCMGLYSRLGVAVHFAKPYNGKAKPVERFFGTMGTQLENKLPSYIGNAITNKPAHLMRNEKIHKKLHLARTKGWVPNIREAAEILDRYVYQFNTTEHSSLCAEYSYLEGLAPWDLVEPYRTPISQDTMNKLREDFMLRAYPVPDRCRVKVNGLQYEGECLHGLERHKKIEVRYEWSDYERVYCYMRDGRYLGEATAVIKVNPMISEFGGTIAAYRFHVAIREKHRIIRNAKKTFKEMGVEKSAANKLIEEFSGDIEAAIQQGHLDLSTDGLKRLPELKKDVVKEPELSEEELAEQLAEREQWQEESMEPDTPEDDGPVVDAEFESVDPMEEYKAELDGLRPVNRYERLMVLEVQGVDIGPEYRAFMRYFEETKEYRDQAAELVQRRVILAEAYK